MTRYYQGTVGKNADFEADTLEALQDKVISYYGEDIDLSEGNPSAPEFTQIIRYENDEEHIFTGNALDACNKVMAGLWDEELVSAAQPSDYEEHNTHWGL